MKIRWLIGTLSGIVAIYGAVYGYAAHVYVHTFEWEFLAEAVPVIIAAAFVLLCLLSVFDKSRFLTLLVVLVLVPATPILSVYANVKREGIRCYQVPARVTIEPTSFLTESFVSEHVLDVCHSDRHGWYVSADFR